TIEPSKQYTYEPLQDSREWIRLLYLLPAGDRDDSLRAILTAVRHDQVPDLVDYEPVSYTWGLEAPTSALYLSDPKKDRFFHFPIRPNLEKMLRVFREEGNLPFLWIDAICINQMDNEEKGFQVQTMDHVYQGQFLRIWLGEPSQNSDLALELI
ncbi:HET-domain-containing protein, partial [Thozetella sp. PMI_491]